jgi:hypothetical protein
MTGNLKFFTGILSFLNRERESFPLFVPRRYCIPGRAFQGVSDRSALQPFSVTTVHRFLPLNERFRHFSNERILVFTSY